VLRSGHQIAAHAPPNGDQNRDREVSGRFWLESTGWPVTGPLISLGFLTGWPVHSNEDPRQDAMPISLALQKHRQPLSVTAEI
jgi:hypothetical protein